RMSGIEPCRQMAPRDEMYPMHPGCEPFHGAEPVTQRAPVAVTLHGSIGRTVRSPCAGSLRASAQIPVFPELPAPGRVASVHPGNHEIYIVPFSLHKPKTIDYAPTRIGFLPSESVIH